MSTSKTPSPPPIRVLLVEDNPGDVFLLTEILGEAPIPFEVEQCARLSDAVQRLSKGGIDVVITDLSLPDSVGIETFHDLAKQFPRLPVVVLSGTDDEALALRTVEEGAQDYLVKGKLDQALLVRSLRYAIKRAEAERRLAEERALLRNVIDNLPDSVYVKDANGCYLLDNLAHMRQVGVASLEQVVGKKTTDFFPPEKAEAFLADDERVIKTGQPIINRHEFVESETGPRWLSTTKVPLRDSQGHIIGIIGIGRDITMRKNAEAQLAQYTQELREKNAELEDDLNMAREVQQAFLPQQFPTFPRKAPVEESAIRFVSRYLPTTTLGGDFFHIVPISDTQAGVFICDVMGHGVRAALITAIQRALVEELFEFAPRPGEFLTHMNASLLSILRRTGNPLFASAFYLVVDVQAGLLQYANAGHPLPLHVHRPTHSVTALAGSGGRPGPALGVFDDSRYATYTAPVAEGDVVMLFTDGLYEVEGARGQYFDQERIVAGIERRAHLPTEQIFEQTLDEVRKFSATGGFIDDVCMVAVEVIRIGSSAHANQAFTPAGQIS